MVSTAGALSPWLTILQGGALSVLLALIVWFVRAISGLNPKLYSGGAVKKILDNYDASLARMQQGYQEAQLQSSERLAAANEREAKLWTVLDLAGQRAQAQTEALDDLARSVEQIQRYVEQIRELGRSAPSPPDPGGRGREQRARPRP